MWNKLKWKLQQYMIGRNGSDDLCRSLTGVSLVIYIISVIADSGLLYYISLAGIMYSLWRSLSRNIAARRQENQKFLGMVELSKLRFQNRKEYKYFKCKTCGRNVRIPRGKGKIEVTCPICKTKVIMRT